MGLTVGPATWHPTNINVGNVPLGTSIEGGFLICRAGGVGWIVSPRSTEVSRTWTLRTGANTTAQSASGCTGWFIPTVSQLQNPGYLCRSFWGPSPCFSSTNYWSSTDADPFACFVDFTTGLSGYTVKTNAYCVRAFRCVTY